MNDVIILRVLFDGIRSLSIVELFVYVGTFFLWLFGISYLFRGKFKEKKKFSSVAIRSWVIVLLILIFGKIALLEYLNYLNHTTSLFWAYMKHLLIPSAMIGDIFGLVYAESDTHYRLAFYTGIIIASFLFAAPLLGIKMTNNEKDVFIEN